MTKLAERLLDHALKVMPPERRDWIRAMQAELDHIPDAPIAVLFALGGVWTSYGQWALRTLTLARLTRWALAIGALAWAGCYAVATAMMIGIKATPGITPQDLGSGPGTAANLRFFQTYPMTNVAVLPVVALLLVAGAVLLVRRRPDALPLLALALTGGLIVAIADLGRDWPLAWSGGWMVPLLCLAPVWWLSRRAPDLRSA